jgi:hypothetical protein
MSKLIHRTVPDVKDLYCFSLLEHSINNPIDVRPLAIQQVPQLFVFRGWGASKRAVF